MNILDYMPWLFGLGISTYLYFITNDLWPIIGFAVGSIIAHLVSRYRKGKIMDKIILECSDSTTVKELVNLLNQYPEDMQVLYIPNNKVTDFEIVELYNELRLHYNPNDLKVMLLAIRPKI